MIPTTNEVRIETSTHCNAGCVFCPWPTDDFTRRKEIMSVDDYKFYVDKIRQEVPDQITETTISGFGEAFTDPTLLKKIKYAVSAGLDMHVLTNGSYLTEEIIDELYEIGILSLRVSIHTTNEESYKKVLNYRSGRFTLDKVMKAMDYAIKNKPDGTEIVIPPIIVEENRNDVDKLIDDFGDKVSLEIWAPHNWVDTKDYRSKESGLVHDSCGRPFNGPIQVQVDGDVIMCCFDFNNKMVLGNFKEQTLEEIYELNGKNLFSKIHKHHSEGTCGESDLICSNCDQLKLSTDVIIYNNRGPTPEERITMVTPGLAKIKE
jgi:radical SAM protein with 4Fe4S-binding SPASM domain|tara:strand:+ start:524 stop:1477 length:954 start_codon:yes stop_codon:yes gene_type:complete